MSRKRLSDRRHSQIFELKLRCLHNTASFSRFAERSPGLRVDADMTDVTHRDDQLFSAALEMLREKTVLIERFERKINCMLETVDDWAEDLKLADEAIVDLYERLSWCGL
jgi:hypothetical protein